jgi:hydrogenase nickel incorporation protein HypB
VERIAKLGIATVQISTGKECHLDANLVKKALSRVDLASLDLILIENVGNLICPAEFHLGSDTRVVVTSVTEGPYMIVKHPFIFMDAKLAVVNKIDLAEAMGVDIEALKYDLKTVNPAIVAIPTNCRTGEGVEDVIQALGL